MTIGDALRCDYVSANFELVEALEIEKTNKLEFTFVIS